MINRILSYIKSIANKIKRREKMKYLDINQAVEEIKCLIETAIINGGESKKNNLIRSQKPICILHDVVKASFIDHGVHPDLVKPIYGEHRGEIKLAGFFKQKNQDICFMPRAVKAEKEILKFDGILKGVSDKYGFNLTEKILSVNVRSQLSSSAKNFDTLYERTFAEALNLHLRCPKMVLGEFYMIPVYEYDNKLAKQRIISFKENNQIHKHLEKYIHAFNAINNRTDIESQEYKYERVCLLIVDFNRPKPKIYNYTKELIKDGLLPTNTDAQIENINFPSFTRSLLDIYNQRFGNGNFK